MQDGRFAHEVKSAKQVTSARLDEATLAAYTTLENKRMLLSRSWFVFTRTLQKENPHLKVLSEEISKLTVTIILIQLSS
jgi:hypothetical protein